MEREQFNVTDSLAQRRHADRLLFDTFKQILAEIPAPNRFGKIDVGGADEPRPELNLLLPSKTTETPLLNHAQQLALQRRRKVSDLIEEKRSISGLLKISDAALFSVGENSFLVAEHLALEQVLGNGRDLHVNPRLVGMRPQLVNRPGEQFFAGP